MTAQVVYLNAWLNCPDDVLRFHYILQDKINEGKAEFWYNLSRQGITGYQAQLCYDRFVHSNRDRLKVIKDEADNL
jgi:hypothetical protein